jgi:N-acetylneuraminate synthase
MSTNSVLKIENNLVGHGYPVYFIADIAANHDGDLERAKDLIYLAAESGANAAKFQHFKAETIVSDRGFKSLGSQQSHQSSWKKSVFEIYKDASVNINWTITLKETCQAAGITFFTSPYSLDIVDYIDPYVPAHKIGSGDITWIEIIEHIARKNKPYILATGASNLQDVQRAVCAGLEINPSMCLMQCNTNYTASLENFQYINLNVLKVYKEMYPEIVLGLSDHTPGHATVLGAIALGAKMIEKHFTDKTDRDGPDHKFSMDPKSWREMVDRSRELENALGSTIKKVEENELDTIILQRRSIRLTCDLSAGTQLQRNHITFLRPCPQDGLPPFEVNEVLGKTLRTNKQNGDHIKWTDLE